jgi:starch phosphorylase
MVTEYVNKFYGPASRQWRRYSASGFDAAQSVALWKAKIRQAWSGVSLKRVEEPLKRITYGESIELKVAVNLNGLLPEDVRVEVLVGRASKQGQDKDIQAVQMKPVPTTSVPTTSENPSADDCLYQLELTPELCGRLIYRVRIYPCNDLLTHPFETGLMIWL